MGYYTAKIAVVTGGASGIGRELCLALAQQGAGAVIVADLNNANAQKTVNRIREAGGQADAIKVDVSRRADVKSLVARTVDRYGRIDLMFNNAGIGLIGEMRDIPLDLWERIINVDLWGVIYGSHYAYQQMIRQGGGHIINTASAAGLWPAPIDLPYTTAKHGVVGLSNSLRIEGKGLGVRVSVICPGLIKTEIFDNMPIVSPLKEGGTEAIKARLSNGMPAQECARIILRRVARNQGVIPITIPAEIGWRIYRYAPGLFELVLNTLVDFIRRYRSDPAA